MEFAGSDLKFEVWEESSFLGHPNFYRALIVAGAEGATAPINFEQRVHAPVNFQPFLFYFSLTFADFSAVFLGCKIGMAIFCRMQKFYHRLQMIIAILGL